jgi:CRISPR system Cascade subunit CasE
VFLSKLTLNPRSHTFRRDVADVHDMHRTVMSAYPELSTTAGYRQAHGVLWRIDTVHSGLVQYVQSRTAPDWDRLPEGHLLKPAEVRSLQPVLDSIAAGRRFAFRLLANPTRCVRPEQAPHLRKRVPHRQPAKQIEWLVGKGEQHGFVVPTSRRGGPDIVPTPVPTLVGKRRDRQRITVEPARFDGHLVVTDPVAFTDAIVNGIGRAKSYGCGLLSLAPPRTT